MKLVIPPPIVLIFSLCCAYGLGRFLPLYEFAWPLRQSIAVLLLCCGLLMVVRAAISFLRFKTTVHPHKPSATSTIVKTGLFRFSRNPMYLGMLLILVGYCYFLAALSGFIMPVLFVLYITAFQIKPEEAALETKFGADYLDYKQSVRRWL